MRSALSIGDFLTGVVTCRSWRLSAAAIVLVEVRGRGAKPWTEARRFESRRPISLDEKV